jgi:transcription elongation factor GreA
VLKATWKKEKLREKIKNDIPWALRTVIKSFDNSCDIKRIKGELCPAILSSGEWPSWGNKAREILKSDPGFGISPDNIDLFTVRDRPISMPEKLYNEFQVEKNFFNRAAIIRSYVNQKNADLDTEFFSEMFSYFAAILKSSGHADEQTIASYLLIKEMAVKNPHLGTGISLNFADLFKEIKNLGELYENLKDAKIREDFLAAVRMFIPRWQEIYVKLFPVSLAQSIITQLKSEGYDSMLTAMCADCFERFRENRGAVLWLFKNSRDTPWFKAANISPERQLLTLIHILDISYRDIENHKDTTENRKINRMVYNILFKENFLNLFIEDADTDTITRIFTFINDVKYLDPQDKLNLRSAILDRHPDFKFFGDVEKKVSSALMVTNAKYEEKQKQLARILEEEIPANSKEIAYALSLGDLRENAEYKAAKEKQDQLNNQVTKLKEEIERARIFDPNSINSSRISFGTKVILHNITKEQKEEFTILGPWESNPDNNIISYLSPFGSAILNKTEGDQFEFAINDEKNTYLVESISLANV